MSKIVLFQTIYFSISTQFSSICHIDRTLSGATTPSQSVPRSYGNEEYSAFPKAPALMPWNLVCDSMKPRSYRLNSIVLNI